MPVSDTYKKTR